MFTLINFILYIRNKAKLFGTKRAFSVLGKSTKGTNKGNSLANKVGARKQKKLTKRLKILKYTFILAIVMDFFFIYTFITMANNYMNIIKSITTIGQLYDEVYNPLEDEEYGWEWEGQPGVGEDGEFDGIYTPGGIYPKDPKLKQLAMYIEAAETSASEANKALGVDYVNGAAIFGINMRESGGNLVNRLVGDASLNIFRDLIWEHPACRMASCGYIKKGYPHFEGGTVTSRIDNSNPATNKINGNQSHYSSGKGPGGHAIGYFQLESTSADGYLRAVYPIGGHETKDFSGADKYTKDEQLGFIRPNGVYMPDAMLATGYHIADIGRYGTSKNQDGYKRAWEEINKSSWFNNLTKEEQQFCWIALKDMSYQTGGNISYDSTASVRTLIELIATLRLEGRMNSVLDTAELLAGYNSNIKNSLESSYNKKTHTVSRPGDNMWVYGFNSLLDDGNLPPKSKAVANRLKGILNGGKFKTYSEAGEKALYVDIPAKTVGHMTLNVKIFQDMKQQVNEAEKEESQGIGGPIRPPVGVSPDNFQLSPGVGQGNWGGKTTLELVGSKAKHIDVLRPMFGTSMTLSSGKDPMQSLTSKFAVPYFSQSSSLGNEAWSGHSTGNFNLQSAGCAVYMWAHVTSALQQRLINPAEMLVVGRHYGIYNSQGLWVHSAVPSQNMFKTFGYTTRFYSRTGASYDQPWEDLNQALLKDIPSGFRARHTYSSGPSHFLAIDAITEDGRYKLSQTNKSALENITHSRSDIWNSMFLSNPCLFVVDVNN